MVTNGDAVGPPNTLFVLVANDKYVYLVQKDIDIKLNEIKTCKKIYDSLISKKGDIEVVEQEAWNRHCECYQERFKNEPQFDSIKKEIAIIVNYIEH